MPRWIKSLLLMVLTSFLSLTSCNRFNFQKPTPTTEATTISSECRVIQHRLGETCIPFEPQRIIALDVPSILDSLIALEIKPVGTAVDHFGDGEDWSGDRYFPALMPELVEGIESVGSEGTPSLERILELKPDLILLPDFAEQSYAQLSKIASTVLVDIYNVKASIKDTLRYIAQLVGREGKAENVLDQYQERIEVFQEQLGDQLSGLEVSAIAHYGGEYYTSPESAPYMQVFRDIGIPIKPIFQGQEEWVTFSLEVIDQYDADILFIVEDAGGSAEFISQLPLVLALEAVKNNNAYIVDRRIWDFSGPIGMNLFLDDLSKYLLEGKKDPYFHKSN